jgi:hypothetical protein
MLGTPILVAACTAAILASGVFASSGNAAANATMKACSTQWAAMKTAGTVRAGEKWNDFLKTCAANSNAAATTPAAVPVAQTKPIAAPAATPVAQATPVAKPTLAIKLKKLATSAAAPAAATSTVVASAPAATTASGGTVGEQSRIQRCGVQWKAAKSSNTAPAGQTWPQFWSACDARLKAGG